MLKLPLRSEAGLLVADDDADGTRRFVCAGSPRVARRSDGRARLRLTRFMLPDGRAVADGSRTASRLVLDAELEPSPDTLAAAGLAGAERLPWLDAELELRGPQFDPVSAPASVVRGQAGVGVELPAATAAIVAGLLRAPTSASLQLSWRGHVRARLPAVEVTASVDLAQLQRRGVGPLLGRGRLPIGTRVVLQALVTANVRVDIQRGAGPQDDAIEAALRAWAIDALVERIEQRGSTLVRATASDVVVLPLELVGVIDDSLRDDERGGLVEEVVLDEAELGGRRRTWVRAMGELAAGVTRVDVELDDAGSVQRVALVDDAAQRVVLEHDRLRWRARVVPQGGGDARWSDWSEAAVGGDVVVPAVLPAPRALEVATAAFDFTQRWLDVQLEIQAAGTDAQTQTQTLVLDAGTPTARVSLPGISAGAPLEVRVQCRARSGFVHEQRLEAVTDAQLVVIDPYAGAGRRLALVPTGSGWAEVAMGMVDLRLVDGEHEVRETVALSRLEDFVQWQAPLSAATRGTLSWRRHTSFRDGRFESTPWLDTELDVLPIALEGTPSRTVQLLPVHLEQGMALRIVLRSGDLTVELQGHDRTPLSAVLPPGPYRMTLSWTMADGGTQSLPEQQVDDDAVVIPRPPLAPP